MEITRGCLYFSSDTKLKKNPPLSSQIMRRNTIKFSPDKFFQHILKSMLLEADFTGILTQWSGIAEVFQRRPENYLRQQSLRSNRTYMYQ